MEEIGSNLDVVLVGERVGATHGLELIREARRSGATVPMLLVSEDVVPAAADDGPGVPRERETTIFDRRQTEHGTGVSLGIGLLISRELARQLGGDLVYARSADTTRFELILPVHDE